MARAVETNEYGDLFVDRDGRRYTTACFGADGDPWQGALILTSGVIRRLKDDGLLPLTEVVRWTPATPRKISTHARRTALASALLLIGGMAAALVGRL